MTEQEFTKLKKLVETANRKELNEAHLELILAYEELSQKVDQLMKDKTSLNTAYLSRCRSVNGITLPPGM